MTATSKTYAICGAIRMMGESDDCIARLAKKDGILSKYVPNIWHFTLTAIVLNFFFFLSFQKLLEIFISLTITIWIVKTSGNKIFCKKAISWKFLYICEKPVIQPSQFWIQESRCNVTIHSSKCAIFLHYSFRYSDHTDKHLLIFSSSSANFLRIMRVVEEIEKSNEKWIKWYRGI